MPLLPQHYSSNAQGLIWGLIATAGFSANTAMSKVAVSDYHVLQNLFFRQVVVFLSVLPEISQSYPQSLKTQRPWIHVSRLAGAFIAMTCSIWAVSLLPLTTAVVLGFSQTFLVVLLATLFLKEMIGVHRIGAVIAGFIGVLIVMRPSAEGFTELSMLIPIIGALGASVAIVSVRKLSQTESNATLLVYQSLFIGLLSGIPLFWLWKTPSAGGWVFLLSMGVVAAFAQRAGVTALRLGEASVVGNIHYTQMIYAVVFGYLLFNEIPDGYTMLGAGIIIGSSLYLFHREQRVLRVR